MKEFMLLIRNQGNPVADLSPDQQQEHINKVGAFMGKMFEEGKMHAAQPLETEGAVVTFEDNYFNSHPIDLNREVISGYYLVKANDLNEAVEIAKADPRFEDGKWKIEVRPIMKIEGIN
ncbi:MAG: hypothetical protein HKN16_09370 [Saprospiraceae bacterium]|nr:hypothetical protein [Saprospiraceae bacterium]